MTARFTLKIAKNTWLTLSKSQSTALPDDQKHHVLADESFPLSSYKMEEHYYEITLDGDQIDGHSTWFVIVSSDVQIEEGLRMRVASFLQQIPGVKFVGRLLSLAPATGHEMTIQAMGMGHETTPEPKKP